MVDVLDDAFLRITFAQLLWMFSTATSSRIDTLGNPKPQIIDEFYIAVDNPHRGLDVVGDERWGAGVETQKNKRGEIGVGVEYHLMSPTPRR